MCKSGPSGLESEEKEIPTVNITLLPAKASGCQQLMVTSSPAETAILTTLRAQARRELYNSCDCSILPRLILY